MTDTGTGEYAVKPTDLRGILKYVPMFRDHVFIVALDGSLVAHENFQNVLLDIAVLRSLQIKIVLVHGIGQQLNTLAAERKITLTNAHGEGPTDEATLALATEVSALVSMQIMQGLTRNGLRCAQTNGVRSKEFGIVKGTNQLHSGKVDKLDLTLFNQLLSANTIPVVSPIAFNRDGASLRINSDLLAADLAAQLSASKLIYMTTQDGLQIDGIPITNLPVADLESFFEKSHEAIPERLLSKVEHAVKAIHAGIPRAHLLNGRTFGALLNEVFDKVGIGTMVYSNDYQSIRPAVKADAYAIYNITRNGVRSDTLRNRTQAEIETAIENFLVYEIDGSLIGCVTLQTYPDSTVVEIGSVYVQPFYQNKGVGQRMVEYACKAAAEKGATQVVAVSTQAIKFFTEVCGFDEFTSDDLPEPRRSEVKTNGRNAKVFVKQL
jgi:amino-acid N-acetyltransferase